MIPKPTQDELREWNAKLKAEGLDDPDDPWRGAERLIEESIASDTPAEGVRDGGLRFRRRKYYYSVRQAFNKKRPRVRVTCPECGTNFEGTKRARFCSDLCATRVRVRRFRSKDVTPNVRSLYEGESQ